MWATLKASGSQLSTALPIARVTSTSPKAILVLSCIRLLKTELTRTLLSSHLPLTLMEIAQPYITMIRPWHRVKRLKPIAHLKSAALLTLPQTIVVYTPASQANLQYLKDGAFVDVPTTLNVVKNDSVTFKAIPSPAGTHFYLNEPRWGGTSGATGQGETTQATFNTLSKNTHDYKTVTANVTVSTISGGVTTTANVIVADGVESISLEKIDPASILDDNPNA